MRATRCQRPAPEMSQRTLAVRVRRWLGRSFLTKATPSMTKNAAPQASHSSEKTVTGHPLRAVGCRTVTESVRSGILCR